MLRQTLRFLPVVIASFFLLVHGPERASAQLPAGNDTSDALANTGGGKNALGQTSRPWDLGRAV
jgi:hypothetical protein